MRGQSSCANSAVSKALSAARHMGAGAGRSQSYSPSTYRRACPASRRRPGALCRERAAGQIRRSAAGQALCAANPILVGAERSPTHRVTRRPRSAERGGSGGHKADAGSQAARGLAGHWQALCAPHSKGGDQRKSPILCEIFRRACLRAFQNLRPYQRICMDKPSGEEEP